MCREVQGIGVIDFANRGSKTKVLPTFGKHLSDVECVNCGQCVRVCPTGALSSKSAVTQIWQDIWDEKKKVAVQIAPAVRVALGEMYGLSEGSNTTGLIVSALRMLGFDYVYDTSYSADLTIVEEATEFLKRFEKREKLPMFTSCCPAWVKHVEHCHADLLDNLSTCKSPQQMLSSLIKETYVRNGGKREELSVVSVMPCTAKKYEAKRPEFSRNGDYDTSNVLTTMELARMIDEKGIQFGELEPSAFDLPYGFKTGAGIIFGHSGGVTEAVIRFVLGKISPSADYKPVCKTLQETKDFKELELAVGDNKVKIAVVSGLKNAQKLIKDIKEGKRQFDFVEVMACPNGCINGAGQPAAQTKNVVLRRAEGLYNIDNQIQVHKPQDNHYISKMYEEFAGEIGGHTAHELFHTHYHAQKRIKLDNAAQTSDKTNIEVCFGTSCVLRGAKKLFEEIHNYAKNNNLNAKIKMSPSFCFEKCTKGPVVKINGVVIEKSDLDKVKIVLEQQTAQTVK
jgi:NADH-quinone oxidoreductase subunit G